MPASPPDPTPGWVSVAQGRDATRSDRNRWLPVPGARSRRPGSRCDPGRQETRPRAGGGAGPGPARWWWTSTPGSCSSGPSPPSASTAYYNWPYTFGLLFGIGLSAEFPRDPTRFRSGYDDLLSATGLGDAPSLAARFAIDVRDVAFWTASLDVLRARIDEFVVAAGA